MQDTTIRTTFNIVPDPHVRSLYYVHLNGTALYNRPDMLDEQHCAALMKESRQALYITDNVLVFHFTKRWTTSDCGDPMDWLDEQMRMLDAIMYDHDRQTNCSPHELTCAGPGIVELLLKQDLEDQATTVVGLLAEALRPARFAMHGNRSTVSVFYDPDDYTAPDIYTLLVPALMTIDPATSSQLHA